MKPKSPAPIFNGNDPNVLISIPEAARKYGRNRQWFITIRSKGIDIGRCRHDRRVCYDRAKLDAYMKKISKKPDTSFALGLKQPARYHDCATYATCLEKAAISNEALACEGCGRYLKMERAVY